MGTGARAARRVIAVGVGAILASSALVAWRRSGRDAAGFLAAALATWLLVAEILRRAWREAKAACGAEDRAQDRTQGGPRIGAATGLTLLRGLLISLVAGCLALPSVGGTRWLPGLLYAAAVLGDHYDGILARRLGQVTPLGVRMDVAMDALGLLVAPLVGVAWGRLPPWYLLLGAAYYLFQAAVILRRRLGWPVYTQRLRRNRYARFFAGAQMVVVSVALCPLMDPALTAPLATLVMLPTLFLFGREWLIVTGRRAAPQAAEATGLTPGAGGASPGSAPR